MSWLGFAISPWFNKNDPRNHTNLRQLRVSSWIVLPSKGVSQTGHHFQFDLENQEPEIVPALLFLFSLLGAAGRVLPLNFKQGNRLLAVLDVDGFARGQLISRVRSFGGDFADQNLSRFRI